jgi:hypothetical protein
MDTNLRHMFFAIQGTLHGLLTRTMARDLGQAVSGSTRLCRCESRRISIKRKKPPMVLRIEGFS